MTLNLSQAGARPYPEPTSCGASAPDDGAASDGGDGRACPPSRPGNDPGPCGCRADSRPPGPERPWRPAVRRSPRRSVDGAFSSFLTIHGEGPAPVRTMAWGRVNVPAPDCNKETLGAVRR